MVSIVRAAESQPVSPPFTLKRIGKHLYLSCRNSAPPERRTSSNTSRFPPLRKTKTKAQSKTMNENAAWEQHVQRRMNAVTKALKEKTFTYDMFCAITVRIPRTDKRTWNWERRGTATAASEERRFSLVETRRDEEVGYVADRVVGAQRADRGRSDACPFVQSTAVRMEEDSAVFPEVGVVDAEDNRLNSDGDVFADVSGETVEVDDSSAVSVTIEEDLGSVSEDRRNGVMEKPSERDDNRSTDTNSDSYTFVVEDSTGIAEDTVNCVVEPQVESEDNRTNAEMGEIPRTATGTEQTRVDSPRMEKISCELVAEVDEEQPVSAASSSRSPVEMENLIYDKDVSSFLDYSLLRYYTKNAEKSRSLITRADPNLCPVDPIVGEEVERPEEGLDYEDVFDEDENHDPILLSNRYENYSVYQSLENDRVTAANGNGIGGDACSELLPQARWHGLNENVEFAAEYRSAHTKLAEESPAIHVRTVSPVLAIPLCDFELRPESWLMTRDEDIGSRTAESTPIEARKRVPAPGCLVNVSAEGEVFIGGEGPNVSFTERRAAVAKRLFRGFDTAELQFAETDSEKEDCGRASTTSENVLDAVDEQRCHEEEISPKNVTATNSVNRDEENTVLKNSPHSPVITNEEGSATVKRLLRGFGVADSDLEEEERCSPRRTSITSSCCENAFDELEQRFAKESTSPKSATSVDADVESVESFAAAAAEEESSFRPGAGKTVPGGAGVDGEPHYLDVMYNEFEVRNGTTEADVGSIASKRPSSCAGEESVAVRRKRNTYGIRESEESTAGTDDTESLPDSAIARWCRAEVNSSARSKNMEEYLRRERVSWETHRIFDLLDETSSTGSSTFSMYTGDGWRRKKVGKKKMATKRSAGSRRSLRADSNKQKGAVADDDDDDGTGSSNAEFIMSKCQSWEERNELSAAYVQYCRKEMEEENCLNTVFPLSLSPDLEGPTCSDSFEFQPFSDEPRRTQNGNSETSQTKACMDPKMIKWNSLPDSLETAIIPQEKKLQMIREQFILEAQKKKRAWN